MFCGYTSPSVTQLPLTVVTDRRSYCQPHRLTHLANNDQCREKEDDRLLKVIYPSQYSCIAISYCSFHRSYRQPHRLTRLQITSSAERRMITRKTSHQAQLCRSSPLMSQLAVTVVVILLIVNLIALPTLRMTAVPTERQQQQRRSVSSPTSSPYPSCGYLAVQREEWWQENISPRST